MRFHALIAAFALALVGCPEPTPDPEPTPGTDPVCGDGEINGDDTCDDGNLFGGDGCSPSCTVEPLPGEEPNNGTHLTAQLLPAAGSVIGGLPAGDKDCYGFKVPERGWIAADVSIEDGCPDAQLSLHAPGGGLLASGTPGELDGCSAIDPIRDIGARYAPGGVWAVCVQGFLGAEVPTYTLSVQVGNDTCELPGLPFTSDADPDGDGSPNVCDEDDDGDGLDDEDDNCPNVPNTGDVTPLSVDSGGYIRTWLLAGPLPDLPSDTACMPSLTEVLGDDAAAEPALGDPAGDTNFFAYFSNKSRINFLRTMGGPTPREVYGAVWVRSDETRDVTLAIGADDGIRTWFNGVEVMEVGSCQGTNRDQFTADVQLLAGWNRLLVEVRDQGGGWGLFARFKDGDDAITDLEVSLSADAPWAPDQSDLDGDGLGDVCDETPAGD